MTLTYQEMTEIVKNAGFDKSTTATFLGQLERIDAADWMTANEKQRKYAIILNALDAQTQATYYNRFGTIVKDTLAQTAEDLKSVGGGVFDVVKNVVNPVSLIAIAVIVLVILILK